MKADDTARISGGNRCAGDRGRARVTDISARGGGGVGVGRLGSQVFLLAAADSDRAHRIRDQISLHNPRCARRRSWPRGRSSPSWAYAAVGYRLVLERRLRKPFSACWTGERPDRDR